jgi:outer membrane protein TolC
LTAGRTTAYPHSRAVDFLDRNATVFLLTPLLALVPTVSAVPLSALSAPAPTVEPAPPPATEPVGPQPGEEPGAVTDAALDPAGVPTAESVEEPHDIPVRGLSVDYVPPFESTHLELSQVLKHAVVGNLDLAINAVDIEISETQIQAALGVYDLMLTAGLNASASETPQRGSQFTFSLGTRTIGGNLGLTRRLETGGNLTFSVQANRQKSKQPVNFFDTSAGSVDLSSYALIPTLSITQPLLRGAGIKVNRANLDKAKIAVSQAEAAQQVTAQNLVRDIVNAYWDVLFAHRDLENKQRSTELARKQLERTEALVRAGRVSPVDAKAVEQALAVREGDVINAENTLLNSSLNLRTLMGEDFTRADTLGVLPMTDPVVKPRLVDTRQEIDRALTNNPQVRQLQLGIASRRIDEMVADNNRLPQLDVQGSFTPQGRSVDSIANASTGNPGTQGSWPEAFRNIFSDNVGGDGLLADWTVSGSISLTWDIRNRTPKANYEAAKLQIKRAQTQLEQARQQVSAGVIRAANSLRTTAKVMEVSEISLELSLENLEAEQARFNVGRSTNYDVLQRLDEVDQAESNALNAQISYLKALVELQSLNGEILPAYGLDVR